MPAASVDSSPALLAAPPGGVGQATTVLTPTSVSTLPAVTTTIQPPHSKDTTWTKLFVGGLPYHTTDKSLREHFEVFGDIEEAVVITDRSTGKSRGYGFVIMSTKDAAERACKEPNPIIDGRKANVNLACIGAKPRGNLAASLPLAAAYRPGFPAIIPSQYGDLLTAGHLGLTPASFTASPAGHAAVAQAAGLPAAAAGLPAVTAMSGLSGGAAAAAGLVQAAPGGKARSSMNLGLISGRQAVQAGGGAAMSPYLHQLYAANPYIHPNILNLATMGAQDPYAGNPLLDFYNQYAAAAAASFPPGSVAAAGPGGQTTQAVVPVTANGASLMHSAAVQPSANGGYFGYTYAAPYTAQQLAAAGIPYATAAAAGANSAANGQQQQAAQQQADASWL